MKRRNFLSLFAAGAIIKEPVFPCDGPGQNLGNGEVVMSKPIGLNPIQGGPITVTVPDFVFEGDWVWVGPKRK